MAKIGSTCYASFTLTFDCKLEIIRPLQGYLNIFKSFFMSNFSGAIQGDGDNGGQFEDAEEDEEEAMDTA